MTTARWLGRRHYAQIYAEMREFTAARTPATADQIWSLEHEPVFTQGQAGKAEHVLAAGEIPVLQSNRGGQVTYHGPGQLVVYPLLNIRRLGLGPREMVHGLEQALIDLLAHWNLRGQRRAGAPGIYIAERKIASIGLRISRGCSYHGLALNVAMDLEPFSRINPCGYQGLRMTQLADFEIQAELGAVNRLLLTQLQNKLGLAEIRDLAAAG